MSDFQSNACASFEKRPSVPSTRKCNDAVLACVQTQVSDYFRSSASASVEKQTSVPFPKTPSSSATATALSERSEADAAAAYEKAIRKPDCHLTQLLESLRRQLPSAELQPEPREAQAVDTSITEVQVLDDEGKPEAAVPAAVVAKRGPKRSASQMTISSARSSLGDSAELEILEKGDEDKERKRDKKRRKGEIRSFDNDRDRHDTDRDEKDRDRDRGRDRRDRRDRDRSRGARERRRRSRSL